MLNDNDKEVFRKYERFDVDTPMEERADYRHSRITGSKIATIMGVNKYGGSKFRLAVEMCGNVPPSLPPENLVVRVGSHMESLIWGFAAENRPDFKEFGEFGTLEHPLHEKLAASPDVIINDRYGPAVVEIKNVGKYTAKEWADGQHPKYYEAQLQWYMGILNDIWAVEKKAGEPLFNHGYLIALLENRELAVRFIMFDESWYRQAKAAALEFLEAVERNEPEAFMFEEEDFGDATKVLGEVTKKEASELPNDSEKYIYKMNRLKGEIAVLQAELDEAKFNLAQSIGGAERAENNNFFVSWPWVSGRKKFDLKAFQAANPDMDLSAYYTEGKSYRGGMKITEKEGA